MLLPPFYIFGTYFKEGTFLTFGYVGKYWLSWISNTLKTFSKDGGWRGLFLWVMWCLLNFLNKNFNFELFFQLGWDTFPILLDKFNLRNGRKTKLKSRNISFSRPSFKKQHAQSSWNNKKSSWFWEIDRDHDFFFTNLAPILELNFYHQLACCVEEDCWMRNIGLFLVFWCQNGV